MKNIKKMLVFLFTLTFLLTQSSLLLAATSSKSYSSPTKSYSSGSAKNYSSPPKTAPAQTSPQKNYTPPQTSTTTKSYTPAQTSPQKSYTPPTSTATKGYTPPTSYNRPTGTTSTQRLYSVNHYNYVNPYYSYTPYHSSMFGYYALGWGWHVPYYTPHAHHYYVSDDGGINFLGFLTFLLILGAIGYSCYYFYRKRNAY